MSDAQGVIGVFGALVRVFLLYSLITYRGNSDTYNQLRLFLIINYNQFSFVISLLNLYFILNHIIHTVLQLARSISTTACLSNLCYRNRFYFITMLIMKKRLDISNKK